MKSLWLGAALLLVPLSAGAQKLPEPGARVRVLIEKRTLAVGTLQSVAADSIIIVDAAGTERTLSRAQVRLERSLGKQGNFAKHFAITAGSIAVAGGLLSSLTWSECGNCFIAPQSRSEAFLWGLAAGGIIGVPLGVIAGLAIKVERWEPVRLPGAGGELNRAQPARNRFGVYAALVI